MLYIYTYIKLGITNFTKDRRGRDSRGPKNLHTLVCYSASDFFFSWSIVFSLATSVGTYCTTHESVEKSKSKRALNKHSVLE